MKRYGKSSFLVIGWLFSMIPIFVCCSDDTEAFRRAFATKDWEQLYTLHRANGNIWHEGAEQALRAGNSKEATDIESHYQMYLMGRNNPASGEYWLTHVSCFESINFCFWGFVASVGISMLCAPLVALMLALSAGDR